MPKAFDAEELERQGTVIGSSRIDHEDYAEISGVWEETWCARARLAAQAERYRVWLRERGCSRDHAATMAVRLLLASEPDAPAQTNPSNIPVLH